MLTLPSSAMKLLLDQAKAVGGFLDALTLRLYKQDVALSAGVQLADLVECDFDGYAPFTPLVWGADWQDVGGNWGVSAGSHQFTCTGNTKPQDAFGYFLTSGAAGAEVLHWVERFRDGPYGMRGVAQGALVVVQWSVYDLASALTERL